MGGRNLEDYNRIEFWIYPDCKGLSIVNVDLAFINGNVPAKPGYNMPSGSHLVNLKPGIWNRCFLEINEYQRDQVLGLRFSSTDRGSSIGAKDYSARFVIDRISFQKVRNPDKVSGWEPMKGQIVYSTTGYSVTGKKTAITDYRTGGRFSVVDAETGAVACSGRIRKEVTTTGRFGVLDFPLSQGQGPTESRPEMPKQTLSGSRTTFGTIPAGGFSTTYSVSAAAVKCLGFTESAIKICSPRTTGRGLDIPVAGTTQATFPNKPSRQEM